MGVLKQRELKQKIAGAKALINYASQIRDDDAYFERSCLTHREMIRKHTDLLDSLVEYRENADGIIEKQRKSIAQSRQELAVDRNITKVNQLKRALLSAKSLKENL